MRTKCAKVGLQGWTLVEPDDFLPHEQIFLYYAEHGEMNNLKNPCAILIEGQDGKSLTRQGIWDQMKHIGKMFDENKEIFGGLNPDFIFVYSMFKNRIGHWYLEKWPEDEYAKDLGSYKLCLMNYIGHKRKWGNKCKPLA